MALRYLFGSNARLSSVGRLALAGLVLSVLVVVVVISVVNGFERELRDRVMGLLPHITLELTGNSAFKLQHAGSDSNSGLPEELTQTGLVRGWAPYVTGTVLLAKDDVLLSATATGIDPRSYSSVSGVNRYADREGLQLLSSDKFEIVLGAGLAENLGVERGDQVRLILPVGGVSAIGAIPRQRTMRVADIFVSQSLLDNQLLYLHINVAERLFRGRASYGFQVRVEDLFNLEPVSRALYDYFGDDVRLRTWAQTYGPLYQAIAVQKLTMFVLLSFLVGVAAFNLISGLIMIVEQRKQDVAVLSTLGFGSTGILQLFLLLGGAISISGIFAGLLGGVLFALLLPLLFSAVTEWLGLSLMSQYFIAYLPVDVRVTDLGLIGGAALLFAIVATIFPAYRAAQIMPGNVLAHE